MSRPSRHNARRRTTYSTSSPSSALQEEMTTLYRAIVGGPEKGIAGYLADTVRLPAGDSL